MTGDARCTTQSADWAYVDEHMGKESDRTIAQKVGVSVNTIRRYREKKGISPFRVEASCLPERFVQLLGTMPDQQIADLGAIPVKTVSAARRAKGIGKAYSSRHDAPHATPAAGGSFKWTAAHRQLLGKYPDVAVGRLLNLSKTPVRQERERLGIKPYRTASAFRWTKPRVALLGQASDAELARKWKVSVTQVRNKRISLGIHPTGQDTRKAP